MTIVVAVDREQVRRRTLEEAVSLGDAFEEDVHVVHVLTQSAFLELEHIAMDEMGKPVDMDRVRAVASDIAADAVSEMDATFVPVGLVGDVSDRLVSYAEDVDARYLVVGGRKRSPAGKAVFGSKTQSILLNSSVPVITVLSS